MINFLNFLIGFLIGIFCGTLLASLCFAAKRKEGDTNE